MNVQDKIGRDQAKLLLEEFAPVHLWEPQKVDIFKACAKYKFFVNDTKMERTIHSGRLLFKLEIELLVQSKTIDNQVEEQLKAMLSSDHEGDFAILEGVINSLRSKRLRNSKKAKKNG